jgi:hypothetical protein
MNKIWETFCIDLSYVLGFTWTLLKFYLVIDIGRIFHDRISFNSIPEYFWNEDEPHLDLFYDKLREGGIQCLVRLAILRCFNGSAEVTSVTKYITISAQRGYGGNTPLILYVSMFMISLHLSCFASVSHWVNTMKTWVIGCISMDCISKVLETVKED